jgi:hypothetical protein
MSRVSQLVAHELPLFNRAVDAVVQPESKMGLENSGLQTHLSARTMCRPYNQLD